MDLYVCTAANLVC